MRLLIDANLSPSLKQHLLDRFPESVHVFDLGIENDDDLIWEYAAKHSLILLSKDSDFFHRSKRTQISPKIIWIRKRNCSTAALVQIMENLDVESFMKSDKFKCLIVT